MMSGGGLLERGWGIARRCPYKTFSISASIRNVQSRRGNDSRRISIQQLRRTSLIQPILFRHHPLPQPIRNVIGAQKRHNNDDDMHRDEDEARGVPITEDVTLEAEVASFAAGEDGAGVTGVGGGGFDERVEVAAAVELYAPSSVSQEQQPGSNQRRGYR